MVIRFKNIYFYKIKYNYLVLEQYLISALGETRAAGLKSFVEHQQLVKNKLTSIKPLWPTSTAASSKERQIGPYPIGLTITGACTLKLFTAVIYGFS
jgi:hypothetical protein